MGTSLVFHIVFAVLGVGLPLLLCIAEGLALSPLAHWLTSFPIWISGVTSAWFVVSANSWMNSPADFQIACSASFALYGHYLKKEEERAPAA
jgi:cytochrome bd-type quinol oxidase subunit 1